MEIAIKTDTHSHTFKSDRIISHLILLPLLQVDTTLPHRPRLPYGIVPNTNREIHRHSYKYTLLLSSLTSSLFSIDDCRLQCHSTKNRQHRIRKNHIRNKQTCVKKIKDFLLYASKNKLGESMVLKLKARRDQRARHPRSHLQVRPGCKACS